jgi:hypothetical protein
VITTAVEFYLLDIAAETDIDRVHVRAGNVLRQQRH